MGRMVRRKALLEQLTSSGFKKWSSTTLQAFNNCTIMITNNSDIIRLSISVMLLSLLLIFELIQQAASGEFHVALKHFQNLKNLILNIMKEN